MTTAREQETSHADRHDLDKLARWKTGLDGLSDESPAEGGAAPVPACAIFLVSPDDRASHDIFRCYRSAFEELGGGFHHLVIFGQHGISTTLLAFLAELGEEQASVPLLYIAPLSGTAGVAARVYCLKLPRGERDGELDDSQTWGTALESICASAAGGTPLALAGAPGVSVGAFSCGSLAGAVAGVLEQLGGAP